MLPPGDLLAALRQLRTAALQQELAHAERIAALPAARQASARNLLHYLAVRQVDLRPLQLRLAQLGLSSLGSMETHVLAALDTLSARLEDMLGQPHAHRPAPCCSHGQGAQLLQDNATALLNPPRPRRDLHGQTVEAARLALWFGANPAPQNSAVEPVLLAASLHPALPDVLPPALRLRVTDARKRVRYGTLLRRDGDLMQFTFDRSVYLEEDMAFALQQGRNILCTGTLQGIPEVPGELRLCVGDPLLLLKENRPGRPGVRNPQGTFTEPPQIHCTLADAFHSARAGQSVWLDDGRIGAVIESCAPDVMRLRITHAAPNGSKLKAEKGINFPDTTFDTPALTDKDRADLAAMAAHVDLVALSFLRAPQDVA